MLSGGQKHLDCLNLLSKSGHDKKKKTNTLVSSSEGTILSRRAPITVVENCSAIPPEHEYSSSNKDLQKAWVRRRRSVYKAHSKKQTC